jgi:hypothetical protein
VWYATSYVESRQRKNIKVEVGLQGRGRRSGWRGLGMREIKSSKCDRSTLCAHMK